MEKITLMVLILGATLLSGCKLAENGKRIEAVAIKFSLEHDESGEGYRLAEELVGSTINIYEKAIDLVDANNKVVRSITWDECKKDGGMKILADNEAGNSFAYGEDGKGGSVATWKERNVIKYSFKLK